MSPLELSRSIGFEDVARNAALCLSEELNDLLATEEAEWASKDAAFAAAMGVTIPTIELEPVLTASFHWSHQPSILENPDMGRFPSITCFAYEAQPQPTDMDQYNVYRIVLSVEVLVKSLVGPEDCYSKATRTTDCVHSVFVSNRNLRGIVQKFGNDPRVQMSNAYHEQPSMEEEPSKSFWWQGALMTYGINKTATLGR